MEEQGGSKLQPAVILSCSIFRKELERLRDEGNLKLPIIYLDSLLHLKPEDLQTKMESAVNLALDEYQKVLLLYGDCHPYINDGYEADRVFRVKGINCCEILLGSEDFRRLRRESVFFLLEEWVYRWQEIFIDGLGLTERLAPMFMGSVHKTLVYLDTGSSPIPWEELRQMSLYFKLPMEVLPISDQMLLQAIHTISEGAVFS